ncbi:MAG: phospholipase D-like domain-containing protein [Kiritimatiellae bacterium]|nr:phospholipase D-like domain-containing protein [Kiritimatiellia bacterium]
MRTARLFAGILFIMIGVAHVPANADQTIQPVNNNDYLPAVLDLIHSSTNRLEFLALEYHYDPTIRQIQQALAEAVQRGVTVRGLLENNIDFNAKSLPYLHDLGIAVELDTKKKMLHSKLLVADGKKVLLGSTNWTGNSIDNNNESNVLICDPLIAEYFSRYADTLMKDSLAEPDLPSIQSGSIKTIINRQYFDELLALFQAAHKRIRVIMYGIKYYPEYPQCKTNQLLDALIAAAKRGVDVEVLMDLSDYNHTLNEVNQGAKDYLQTNGVAVFDDSLTQTTHAKVVLVDDAVVIGSANWGYDALERRNETCVLINNPSATQTFADYYDQVKAGGK